MYVFVCVLGWDGGEALRQGNCRGRNLDGWSKRAWLIQGYEDLWVAEQRKRSLDKKMERWTGSSSYRFSVSLNSQKASTWIVRTRHLIGAC